MLVVIEGEETTAINKTHSLENNEEVEQSSRNVEYKRQWQSILVHILKVPQLGDVDTSLLYRHAFSQSETANLYHNASPPARCH